MPIARSPPGNALTFVIGRQLCKARRDKVVRKRPTLTLEQDVARQEKTSDVVELRCN